MVQGRQRIYFDWFLDLLADDPSRISDEYRNAFADAYRTPEALTAGFDWYRALPEDARHNSATTDPVHTPVLYLRGDADPVDASQYLDGFRAAGLSNIDAVVIPHSGHDASLESPDALWAEIQTFCRSV